MSSNSNRGEPPDSEFPRSSSGARNPLVSLLLRALAWSASIAFAVGLCAALGIGVALAVAWPNLPEISELTDYRPKLPLRVYSRDGVLIGEFGEERRDFVPIDKMPAHIKNALIATEDSRFYEHGGIDLQGILRAGIANLLKGNHQGASTITQQVARNFYLSTEKTITRKIYEILLSFKIESQLTKDQIFEVYLNQIFLGNRAYGFAAAAQAYYGKNIKDISVAEAAMLAGLPKAPSAYNPIVNPKRATQRQQYVIDRMLELGFITEPEHAAAKVEQLKLRTTDIDSTAHAEFIAETVRQLMFAQYKEETYSRGLNVYTTVDSRDQDVAYRALRKGLLDYERRQRYRGPEATVDLPADPNAAAELVDEELAKRPDSDGIFTAVVLDASARKVVAVRQDSETLEITGEGLRNAASALGDKAQANVRIKRGSVIRVSRNSKTSYEIVQIPEVEGAFVAIDPRDGSVRALVGGFDFGRNKFNHVTQAWRQPGSSFKPFIYSAGLEKGFTPTTIVNDAPLFFDAGTTGGEPWEPKNYDGKFEGPMTLKRALAKSKNMVSIRVLQTVGAKTAQEWITNFGFDAERHPAYLTMALGAGAVTPMQMATGYSVFANGGYRVNPYLVTRVADKDGKILAQFKPVTAGTGERAIDARNAFIMSNLLQEITRSGTAAKAQGALKRSDLYGKTGTTNDSIDAWFAGYSPTITAVAWMGYDNPRSLGDRETGGGLSLPIWIDYMRHALKGVPITEYNVPPGIVQQGGEYYYEEYAGGRGIGSVGGSDKPAVEGVPPEVTESEKKNILDIFKQ